MTRNCILQSASSLVDIVRAWAEKDSDRPYLSFLPDGSVEGAVDWTYGRLDLRARAIAAAIQDSGQAEGRPVLLMLPPGPDFIAAFFACLYARAIAVPMVPPGLARLSRSFPRLAGIIADSGASLILSSSRFRSAIQEMAGRLESGLHIRQLEVDRIADEQSGQWRRPDLQPDTLGWLQYTSGSTSNPKGVMVSHGNIIANLQSIVQSMELDAMDVNVSWLPPFHDMGLVGGILVCAYLGSRLVSMPPMAFLRRPACWFEAVTHYRAYATGGPNFSLDLCCEKITDRQLERIDLSSLRVFYCGSEAVRLQSVTCFLDRFTRRAGLKRECFYPCYGLAENTLFATGGYIDPAAHGTACLDSAAYAEGRVSLVDGDTKNAIPLVSCGTPGPEIDVRIVDPQSGVEQGEGQLGEIWLRGPSVALGYWRQQDASAMVFAARIAGDGDGSFMRTGDLGFFLQGHLYISGRCKEMIIINGRNFFPQDIEQSVLQAVSGLERNGAAAFGVEVSGSEGLVVVFETGMAATGYDAAIAAIRQIIGECFEIQAHAVVLVKRHSVPKTTSGKIQRALCRRLYLDGQLPILKEWQAKALSGSVSAWGLPPAETGLTGRHAWELWLRKGLAARLGMAVEELQVRTSFSSLGLNSAAAVALTAELQRLCGRVLPVTLLYDYADIQSLAAFLAGTEGRSAPVAEAPGETEEPVAIVGMACRVPGASNPEELFRLLLDGVDAITETPADRWDAETAASPGCRWGGFVAGVGDFDPELFGISPREAAEIDPQQRMLLEVSWEALERAGIAPDTLQGSRTGVFVGISSSDYEHRRLESSVPLNSYVGTGNAHSIAANRLSYVYGLEGPSMAVDSACSSSLLALHLACRSVREGESELALACGVNFLAGPEGAAIFAQAGLMAADGRCKPFSASADGYVRAEGCVVLALKALGRAQRDGDHILALVRASAANQDGRSNGLTAPSRLAQRKVIAAALARAGLQPADIDCVEAHGTGTALGDPIEFGAIADVFAGSRPKDRPLVLSAIKANIGHLEAAAGLAGVCRVLLSLAGDMVPPQIHLDRLSPAIQPGDIPALIPTAARPWPRVAGRPRRAGVSSFGFGGSNVHVILEEAPIASRQGSFAPANVLTVSARSQAQLRHLARHYVQTLGQLAPEAVADFCLTAGAGRADLPERVALVGADLPGQLQAWLEGKRAVISGHVAGGGSQRPLVFLFDGSSPGAADLQELAALPLYQALWSELAEEANVHGFALPADGQSALADFCRACALARLWHRWVGQPAGICCTGRGIFPALCAAGILDFPRGLSLVRAWEQDMRVEIVPDIFAKAAPICPLYDLDAGLAVHASLLRDPAFWRRTAFAAAAPLSREELSAVIAAWGLDADVLFMGAMPEAWQGEAGKGRLFVPALPARDKGESQDMAKSLAYLWVRGVAIDWNAVYYGSGAGKMLLPTYPFANRPFWFDAHRGKRPLPAQAIAGETEAVTAQEACAGGNKTVPVLDEAAALLLIRHEVAAVLRLAEGGEIDDELSLIAAGFDSLLFMELAAGIRKACGIQIPPELFLQGSSIAALARVLVAHSTGGQAAETGQAAIPAVLPDPAHRLEAFPLTDVQHAYWLGRSDSMTLGGVSCSSYLEMDLTGIDLPRLESAITRLVQRHDMLRAVITPDGWQQVLPELPDCRIAVEDLSALAADERDARLLAIREGLSHKVLPVDQAPLFQLSATRLDAVRWRLHLKFDLLIADAFSFGILARDLMAFYADPLLHLPPLALGFRDYVLAMNEAKQGPAWSEDRAYWLERLAGLPAGPELPLAVSPDSIGIPRFERRSGRLEAALWAELKGRARQRNLTPSTVLLAAFSLVLARWCASPKFSLMLTTFDRQDCHPEIFDIVGDFTRLLLLDVSKRAGSSFLEHATKITRQLGRDLGHNRFSAVEVLRELARQEGGEATSSRSAIVFTSALPLTSEDPYAPVEGLNIEVPFAISQTPQVWLDHQVSEYHGDLIYTWDVVEALFPAGLMDELFQSYHAFLLRLVQDEQCWTAPVPLTELPAGQALVRTRVNATAAPFTPEPLYQGILARAALAGGSPAVIGPEGALSFAELVEASSRLAAELQRQGLKTGEVAGVMMTKGWEQVVALLAIQRAGGAYLPVDSELPGKRIAYMFGDAGVRFCLVQPEQAGRAAAAGASPVAVTRDIFHLPAAAVGITPDPASLAYVIYTSGSTGQPKGVMIEHAAALNTLVDLEQRLGLNAHDRVLALANLYFDLSVFDVFGVLRAGGALVFPPAEALRSPAAWCTSMREHGVTIWNTAPSPMQLLLDYLDEHPEERPEGLRLVLLSGDWIPVAMPDRLHRFWPNLTVAALGGATEASIWSNIQIVDEVPASWRSIPYGRPLANQRYYVLDDDFVPCPDFVPGNLHIAGQGLARGYLNDPERSAASFVTDPRSGERLYRTGDLGRYWPDGTLEFLGRRDNQVKINGFRIELGEVETAMQSCPGVRNAAVVAVRDEGGARLAGFVRLEGMAEDRETPEPAGGESPEDHARRAEAMRAAGITLIDAVDRLRFKQEGHNIRHDLGELARRPLSQPAAKVADAAMRAAALSRRISSRRFLDEPVPLTRLAGLLHRLAGFNSPDWPVIKYGYASAGWTYAVQSYVLVKENRVEGLSGGCYYYHPLEDALYLLGAAPPAPEALFPGQNAAICASGAFALFLVAEMAAIEPLYGDRALHFTLIEAGLMSQALEEGAMDESLGLCQIGAVDFEPLRAAFRLGGRHRYLHCLIGGPVKRHEGWTFVEAMRESLPEGALGAEANGGGAIKEIRATLHEWLPDYMVPQTIVALPSLPLTTNGKVDRKALLELAKKGASRAGYVAPGDSTEERLADLIAAILGRDRVSVQENFFDLGATSLQLVLFQRRVSEAMGRQVAITDIFAHPNIRDLSAFLAGTGEAERGVLSAAERRAELRRRMMGATPRRTPQNHRQDR